jgi:hypothetical protein
VVGEELQGAEAVHKSRLAGARMAGRAGPHGDPRRRREREINGEVDSVLKGSDGGAGELHGNKAKLLEGLVWIEKRRGELSTAARSDGNGVQRWRQCSVQEKKKGASERVRDGRSNLIQV